MAITDASLTKLKAGSISKVIESLGSKLKRVGHEYVTQCIWHNDTNPSLTINDDMGMPPHHQVAPVFKTSRAAAEEWAQEYLRTTNQRHDHLQPLEGENSMWTSMKVWISMLDAAHSEALLRPGALDKIGATGYLSAEAAEEIRRVIERHVAERA